MELQAASLLLQVRLASSRPAAAACTDTQAGDAPWRLLAQFLSIRLPPHRLLHAA
jgi:hypothetical protein